MTKLVLTFGIISGVLCSMMMAATVPFADNIGFDKSEFVGYTVMVLSFLLVFFGIRSYRENIGHGQITFIRGFAVGISISLITSLFYVATWEILYFNFLPGFIDKYAAHLVEKAKLSGASPAAIAAQMKQIEQYRAMYNNPFWNAAITFIEPFPVGLVVTLISATVLRRKVRPRTAESALPATS